LEPNYQRSRSFFPDLASQPDHSDSPASPFNQSRSPCREPAAFAAFHRSAFTVAGWTTYRFFLRRQFNLSIFSTPSFQTVVPFPLRGEQLSGFFVSVNRIFRFF